MAKIFGQTSDLELTHSRESLSGYLRRKLGDDKISVPEIDSAADAPRKSKSRDQQTRANLETTQRPESRNYNLRDQQRNISHSTSKQTTESRLDLQFSSLLQSRVDHERTRESTETVTFTASQSIQAGHDAVRAAEQAAKESSESIRETSRAINETGRLFNQANQQLIENHSQLQSSLERARKFLVLRKQAKLKQIKSQNLQSQQNRVESKNLEQTKSVKRRQRGKDNGDLEL